MFPTACIAAYMGTTDPNGWVIANGSTRTNGSNGQYNALITAGIGTGVANGNYTPPDLRAMFLRGIGTNGNTTVGGKTYSGPSSIGFNGLSTTNGYQIDEFQKHKHSYDKTNATRATGNDNFRGSDTYTPTDTSAFGGNETRPVNIGINWIIKL